MWRNIPEEPYVGYAEGIQSERYTSNNPGKNCTVRTTVFHTSCSKTEENTCKHTYTPKHTQIDIINNK